MNEQLSLQKTSQIADSVQEDLSTVARIAGLEADLNTRLRAMDEGQRELYVTELARLAVDGTKATEDAPENMAGKQLTANTIYLAVQLDRLVTREDPSSRNASVLFFDEERRRFENE